MRGSGPVSCDFLIAEDGLKELRDCSQIPRGTPVVGAAAQLLPAEEEQGSQEQGGPARPPAAQPASCPVSQGADSEGLVHQMGQF